MNSPIHFHDEQLIAYLNDAIGAWRRRQLQRHLASCLECRYRLNLLEEEMRNLVATVRSWCDTDLLAIEKAKGTFRDCILLEQAIQPRHDFWSGALRYRWPIAAAVAVLLMVLTLRFTRPSPDLLVRARKAEDRALAQTAVRQEFDVVLSGRGARDSAPRKMEIVFDPLDKRFSVAWRNTDGSLLYGLWRPSTDRALEYYSAEDAGVRPLHSLTMREERVRFANSLIKGTPDMEKALIWWLENRGSLPIRLSREGLLGPSLVKLGHPRSISDVQDLLTLQWKTSTFEHPSVLTLSLNAANYRPVSQLLRCGSAGVEVKLTLMHEELVPPGSIDQSAFEPSPLLIMARLKPAIARPFFIPPSSGAAD